LSLFNDAEVTWKGIADFEERFEAHIDGLVVGGELALEVCVKQASEGDFGEVHAAVRVFCRQNRRDLVLKVLKEVDAGDAQKVEAVVDALKHELPQSWEGDFIPMLWDGEGNLTAILSPVFGYRRFKSAGKCAGLLTRVSPKSLPVVIRTIGRLGDQTAREPLLRLLSHEEEVVCAAAAMSLLRLGEERAASYCLQNTRSRAWARLPVALAGGRAASTEMLDVSRSGQPNGDNLLALGLLGSPFAVPLLIRGLGHPDFAAASAIGLQAITGANLIETAFIPDKIEEDELFEHEREQLMQGKAATRPDGRPYGTTVTRLSQNSKEWERWWAENGNRFNSEVRYRYGKPYSPATLLETLTLEASPHLLRHLAYEEFVIRYGFDFPFETDMLVKEQEAALSKCAEWVNANNGRFTAGGWYFAGRPIQ
jgi:uncharacterized protein (TIGR02270 family)